MAKGAAKESTLGGLHEKITAVFIKVLSRYEQRLEAVEAVDFSEVEDDVLRELFEEGAMPNPAMLSAITKFLKDNDIGYDTQEIDELSDQERRLSERRANRAGLASLQNLKLVGVDGG